MAADLFVNYLHIQHKFLRKPRKQSNACDSGKLFKVLIPHPVNRLVPSTL